MFIIIWRRVTGSTVIQPIVAEFRVAPFVGVMALGTLATKVAAWRRVTGLAII